MKKVQARQSPGGRPCKPLPLWFGRFWLKLRARRRRPSPPSPRGRLYNCARKGKRRVDPAAHRSVFLFTTDWNDDTLIYGVRLDSVPSASGSDEPPMLEILRPCADPLVRWSEEECGPFAAVSGGTIVALAGNRGTVIRDTATGADAPGPRLRRSMRDPALLSVGDDTVLVMDTELRPGRCCFEALRRLPGGDWRADALPNPPVEYHDERGDLDYPLISAYFARGSRAWISVWERGTFSLDMERGTWRREGTWELPLEDLGLFVPELGLVFGIARGIDSRERFCQVRAIDVEVRPPVVRRVWEIPPERMQDVPRWDEVSLAYLGNGRFCVSRSVVIVPGVILSEDKGTSFALLKVSRLPGGDLQLTRHGKVHYHIWPEGYNGHAVFLQHT